MTAPATAPNRFAAIEAADRELVVQAAGVCGLYQELVEQGRAESLPPELRKTLDELVSRYDELNAVRKAARFGS